MALPSYEEQTLSLQVECRRSIGWFVMRKMNEKSCTRRSSGAWFYVHGFAIAVLILCGLRCSASAQVPFVPDDWKFGKRQDSNTLHYCVDTRDPDLPVARQIGEAIAGALLLQPKEHSVGENVVADEIDTLYRVFLETCDIYLGFKLLPDAYPDWMTLSRAYYRAGYVVVAADAGWKSLAEMPRQQAISSTM